MKSASIALLSCTALMATALAACSSDDTTGSPTSTTSAGGSGGSSSTTTIGGGAGTTSASGGGSSSGGSAGSAGAGTGSGGGGTTGAGGSGGASGSGGSKDAGTDSGGKSDAASSDGEAGTSAKAVANIMALPGGTITGTATFTASGADVTVVVALANCPEGIHPMHIHAGTGCANMQEQGTHWDPPRGENIGSGTGQITCMADGTAMLTYTRLGTDAKPWTIGAPAASNVIGHPFIVHGVGVDNMMRHGCGVITAQ